MDTYRENTGEYEERFFLDSEDEIFGLLEKLDSGEVEREMEEYEPGDLTGVADYRLAHPDGRRFSRALIYNDDVTARVELRLETPDGAREVTGVVTEPAYSIFNPGKSAVQTESSNNQYHAKMD